MDPLCEQTPWQSPYAYAANNFINSIDYMGLKPVPAIINLEGEMSRHEMYLFEERQAAWSTGGTNYENEDDWYFYGVGSAYGFLGTGICQLTVLDDYGRVLIHIDDPNNRNVYWYHDYTLTLLGTELDGESYIFGTRPYFMSKNGGIICYYYISKDEEKKWSVIGYRSDSFDRRMEKRLQAIGFGDHEQKFLEYAQPIVQNLALLTPILSQYNDARILIKGENIYGKSASSLDKEFAIISLITFGASKIFPIKEVVEGFKSISTISGVSSCTNSIKEDYHEIFNH